MKNIQIKATNIELTNAIADYVHKKLEHLDRFIKDENHTFYIEVGKTTQHHKNGEYYKAEIKMNHAENNFYAESIKDNLYSAIDTAKDEIVRLLTQKKDKKQTLFKRGAVSVKKMVKGISSRNPFTSRYE